MMNHGSRQRLFEFLATLRRELRSGAPLTPEFREATAGMLDQLEGAVILFDQTAARLRARYPEPSSEAQSERA